MFGRLVDMATRTLIIDLSKGTGGEPMYGMVTVQRTRATSEGTFEVLPWETKLKLFNGIATITEAVTDGPGPFYDSAYLIRVQNGYCAPRWGFMVALPDGTTPISTGDMPKVNPITGEGIYMDAQEWNALYGTLPNRVESLEDYQDEQGTAISELETAMASKGNATARISTTAGKAIYLAQTGSPTEHLVHGDTGWRDISSLLINGYTGTIRIRRTQYDVKLQIVSMSAASATSGAFLVAPSGFGLGNSSIGNVRGFVFDNDTPITMRGVNISGASGSISITQYSATDTSLLGSFEWSTNEVWPTALPGTAIGTIPNL